MKIKLLSALLVCLLILSSCQYILVEDDRETQVRNGAALAENAISSEAAPDGRLRLGSRDTGTEHAVADLQARLIKLNYLGGEADGIFGADTETALIALQHRNGLSETGVLDEATAAALPTAVGNIGLGSRDGEGEHAVADLQARLVELNYLSEEADGIFGKGTEAALIALQRNNGLKETGVLDEATEAALPNAAPAPKVYIGLGSRDGDGEHAVADLQARLIAMHYMRGKADGIFGEASVAALTFFQQLNGLEETGIYDEATEAAMTSPHAIEAPAYLGAGDRDGEGEHAVADLQARLIELYYLKGKADGIFGAGTEAALIAFQQLNELKETGILDEATEAALNSATAAPMPTPTPTPLAKGAYGEDVKTVQLQLKAYGFLYSRADSDFGSDTDEAVRAFQQYQYDMGVITPAPTPMPTPTPTPTPTPSPTPEGMPAPQEIIIDIPLDADEAADAAQAQVDDAPGEGGDAADAEEASGFEPDGVVSDELFKMLTDGSFITFREELSTGSTGREVERLQCRLTDLDYLGTSIDGDFGGNTREALEYFQKRNGLPQTGVADEATQEKLFSADALQSDRPIEKFMLKVSVSNQRVYAYRWANGGYNKLERTMICSTGTSDHATPMGTYSAAGPAGRWYYFTKYKCWAQYAYRIQGPYLFHSVIFSEKDEDTVRWGSVNALGGQASHGCVRLSVEDAKWIYETCPAGTTVKIY